MPWDFSRYEFALSTLIVVTTMTGMGTTLRVLDFVRVIRWPTAVLMVLVTQLVLVPSSALVLSYLLALPEGVALGLLVVAALPGGAYSNLLTHVGRGNGALSITATAIATLACPVTVVIVLRTFGSWQVGADLAIPIGPILVDVLVWMLCPLFLGMFVRHRMQYLGDRIGRICIRASLVLLAAYVVGALTSGRLALPLLGWRSPLAVILMALAAMWLGYLAGALLRLPAADLFTVAIEVLVRNVQLGLLLKATLLPAADPGESSLADGVLFVLLVYGGFSLVLGLSEVFAHRRGIGLVFGRKKSQAASAE
jgi:BASS family bile acid:Na+ symporter